MWNKLIAIFKSTSPKTSSISEKNNYAPEPIELQLNSSGRISLSALVGSANNLSLDKFILHLRVPVLVGSTIHEGKITSQALQRSKDARYRTQVFIAKDILNEATTESESLKNAIYPIMHNPHKPNKSENLIHIGRATDNDLIMPDFSISEMHARIYIQNGTYLIQDAHSTNGTFLNGQRLKADLMQLSEGDQVQVARYEFKVFFPKALYEFLTKS